MYPIIPMTIHADTESQLDYRPFPRLRKSIRVCSGFFGTVCMSGIALGIVALLRRSESNEEIDAG